MLEIILTVLRVAAVALLVRVCWTDYRFLKIWNRDLLILLGIAVTILLISWPVDLGTRLIVAVLLFGLSFLFWMVRWVGAGDVKLFGVAGCLIAPQQAIPFATLILVYSLFILLLCKNCSVFGHTLPIADKRIREMAETGRIPYGVPISLAAITLLLPSLVKALA